MYYLRCSILFMLLIFVTGACADNRELLSYQLENKSKKITIAEALKDIQSAYDQISPDNMNAIVTNSGFLKLVIQSRLVEPDLFRTEARALSNYQEDPLYQNTLKTQKETLPYQLAFQKGQEAIQKAVANQKIEVAEVSRIMFTNGDPIAQGEEVGGVSMQSLLQKLSESDDLIVEFGLLAEEHSQEPLGAQNGGYLGIIKKSQFPGVDQVVFEDKLNGLSPEIIIDPMGSYIVFVHSPTKTVSVSELQDMALSIPPYELELAYIQENIEYLYQIEDDKIFLKGKEVSINDITGKTQMIKFWNKPYTVDQIKETLTAVGGVSDMDPSQLIFLQLFLPIPEQQVNMFSYQLAIFYKGYSPSIKNSKEYKNLLAENEKSVELDTVYNIIAENIFKDLSTNTTDEELRILYEDPNNRQVVDFNEDGAIYASYAESKEQLQQVAMNRKAEEIQQVFRVSLAQKYELVWNEEHIIMFSEELKKDYEQYLSKTQ